MSGLGFDSMQHMNTEHKSTDRPCVSVFVLVIQVEVSVTKNYTHSLQTVLLKGRQCDVTPVLIKYSHFKTMVIDCQAVGCSCVYGACMQDGIKSEGWVLTDRASWRHNNGRVDTQKKQIKTDTHTQTHKMGEEQNINKIRQKEIKVRTNDMLCWGQHISGTGKHDREDPGAFVHWRAFFFFSFSYIFFLTHSKSLSQTWMIKAFRNRSPLVVTNVQLHSALCGRQSLQVHSNI